MLRAEIDCIYQRLCCTEECEEPIVEEEHNCHEDRIEYMNICC